ncbi:MAG TPA: hypothetical protein PLD54_02760 [Candidatus Levybacteria bacterium]|nr:hypothetical protein [Candidatus Levybacteria bacterium]
MTEDGGELLSYGEVVKSKEKDNTQWKFREEKDLQNARFTREVPLKGGTNQVIVVTLDNGGKGIFKPVSGEWTQREFVDIGTYYLRDRAAFLVDRTLNFGLVPTTVVHNAEGKVGSLQEYILDAKMSWHVDQGEYSSLLHKLWIFDQIIWNSDRNYTNILYKENNIFAIDNALTFGPDEINRYGNYFGIDVSEDVVRKIASFAENEQKQAELSEHLLELLSEDEVVACFNRIKHISTLLQSQGSILGEEEIVYNPM